MYFNSGNKNFHSKRVVVFLETQDNPLYYQYVYSIAKKIHDDNGFLHIAFIQERFTFKYIFSIIRFLKRKKCQNILSKDINRAFGYEVSCLNLGQISPQISSAIYRILREITFCYQFLLLSGFTST